MRRARVRRPASRFDQLDLLAALVACRRKLLTGVSFECRFAVLVILLPAALAGALGCGSGTGPGEPPVALVGSWAYEASQVSPASASLEGTLEIERQIGQRMEGSLDVIETSAGAGRRLTGLLTGLALDATTVDFDVAIDGVARRHVAEVRGDSLVGAWVEMRTGGASGTFTAALEAVP